MSDISELLSKGTAYLLSKGIETPALDAALLLSKATGLTREKLYTYTGKVISEQQENDYVQLLERRAKGECVAYILGYKEFWGLNFTVSPAVLVPRPDTEILIEAALGLLPPQASVLDLGVGSGAVAIALKHQRPDIEVVATDISNKALDIARNNARQLGCDISFFLGDLFDALNARNKKFDHAKFDIIVSNPPYVVSDRINSLAPEVQQEPRLALDGGNDGLDIIRRIIELSPLYLHSQGILIMEADPAQMEIITTLMLDRGFGKIKRYRDLSGQDRVIACANECGSCKTSVLATASLKNAGFDGIYADPLGEKLQELLQK